MFPDLLPLDVGTKVSVTGHEFPIGIVVQSFVWLKSEALPPSMFIELMTRSDLPLFRIVTVFSDVLPTFTLPKLTDVGLTDILGGPGAFDRFVPPCVRVKVWPAMVEVPVLELVFVLADSE